MDWFNEIAGLRAHWLKTETGCCITLLTDYSKTNSNYNFAVVLSR